MPIPNNVDVERASCELSGLSIPDASSDSQTPKLTKDASASPDSQSPIATDEIWNPTYIMVQNLGDRSEMDIYTAYYDRPEYRAYESLEEEAKWRAELAARKAEGKVSAVDEGTHRSHPMEFEMIFEKGTCARLTAHLTDLKCVICGEKHHSGKCELCGRDHWTTLCGYFRSVPWNTPLLNERDYKIVCQCGGAVVDGACSRSCLFPGRGRVVSRYLTTPYLLPPRQEYSEK